MRNINSRLVTIQSILVAFFADIRCINWGLTKGGFVGEGVMSLLYIVIVGLIIISVIFSQINLAHTCRGYSIFFPIFLLLFYAITTVFIAPPVVSVSFFLIFTITAFIIPHITFVNPYLMIKSMMILPSFAILRFHDVFASVVDWTNRLPMDVSYGYLIPIIANIVFLWFYFKEENKFAKLITILFSAINFLFFLNILFYGSRAPLLCVFLLICVLWCINITSDNFLIINKKKIAVLSFFIIFIFIFFNPLLNFLTGFLADYGIEIDALSKMVYLQETGFDISNGRSSLNAITLKGIMEHPIFGNGLDQYDNNNPGADYPHNFILQIFYDGGLFLFLLFLPIFTRITKFLKSVNKNKLSVFLVLFFGSVPGALFSQNLWGIPILWMFFGLMLSKGFVYRNNRS